MEMLKSQAELGKLQTSNAYLTEQELNKSQADLRTNTAARDTHQNPTCQHQCRVGDDRRGRDQIAFSLSAPGRCSRISIAAWEKFWMNVASSTQSTRTAEHPSVSSKRRLSRPPTGDTPPCAPGGHARGVHSRTAERPPAEPPVGWVCAPGGAGTGYRAHGAGQPSGVRRTCTTGAAGKAGKAHNTGVILDGYAAPTCHLRRPPRWPECDRRHLSHGRTTSMTEWEAASRPICVGHSAAFFSMDCAAGSGCCTFIRRNAGSVLRKGMLIWRPQKLVEVL